MSKVWATTVRQHRVVPTKGTTMTRPGEGAGGVRAAAGGSIEAALAEIELLAPGPARSRMAEELIRLLLGRPDRGEVAALRYLDQLVQIGDETSPDRPHWRRVRASARSMALMRACAEGEPLDYHVAVAEADGLAAEFADDQQIRTLAAAARAALDMSYGRSDMPAVHRLLDDFAVLGDGNAELASTLKLMSDYVEAFQAQQDDACDGALERLVQVMQRSEEMPILEPVRNAMAETMSVTGLLRAQPSGPESVPDRVATQLRHLAARPGMSAERAAFYLAAWSGTAVMRASDVDRIDAIIADLRNGRTPPGDKDPGQIVQLSSLALAWLRRSEIGGSLHDISRATTLLEQARELAGGPAHPQWAFVNELLALTLRRGGDRERARRVALEGLRGYAWEVLLQPEPTSARAVARSASEMATELVTWFLVDHAPEDALRALDAGRGLMLFAATELRQPGARLVAAGRPELAERWLAEQDPPVRLRHEVLEVLSRGTGLLDPPDLGEIQAALRALDADALVYLVPAAAPLPGWAVIAPADGPPDYLPLPDLAIEEGTDIERYLSALASRDLGPVEDAEAGETGRAGFEASVDAVCDWAWRAAMNWIVAPYLTADRVPHLVLVPMGELARVPWQAARGPNGRYLVERVAISQAASARLLCDTAAAEPVRLTAAGLIVADPDTEGRATSLPSARLEAYAVRDSFYPCATYLGRLPNGAVSESGAGTPEEVRRWLRDDGTASGAMLHLACHGTMDTTLGSAASRLVLAGGDLVAGELTRVLGDNRHRIGLAVLAACHTGRSIHGYDEAYSLATMFLAAGVRSVLSTQWSIPDEDTSLLMYMFHHYLVTERCAPWDALRRAQLWMLDDARTPPDRMPRPVRAVLDRADPGQVVAWAGFVHWGQ